MDTLQQFEQLTGELHELALAENRFLQQHRRAPDDALRKKKTELLARLDAGLKELRELPAQAGGARPALTEKLRARILQLLTLERENEQLLLRCSLPGNAAPAPASAAMLQSIYSRTGR